MTAKLFRQGELLFREGEPIGGVFKVHRGSVEIMRERSGAAIVLGAFEAGQFLREMGVLEGRALRSAGASSTS